MGVINITRASERLQSRPATATRRIEGPNYHIADLSANGRGISNLGRGISDFGRDLVDISAGIIKEERDIEDNENEVEFEKEVRESFTKPDSGYYSLLDKSDNIGSLSSAAQMTGEYADKRIDEFLEQKGYSGNRKERMALRLNSVMRPYVNNATTKYGNRLEYIRGAAYDSAYQGATMSWNSNPKDEEATITKWDAYAAKLVAAGKTEDEARGALEKEKMATAYDYVRHLVNNTESSAELDRMEASVNDKPYEMLKDNKALNREFFGGEPFTAEGVESIKALIAKKKNLIENREASEVTKHYAEGAAAVMEIPDENGDYKPGRLGRITAAMDKLKGDDTTYAHNPKAKAIAQGKWAELDREADRLQTGELNSWIWAKAKMSAEAGEAFEPPKECPAEYGDNPRAKKLWSGVVANFNSEINKGIKARRAEKVESIKRQLNYLMYKENLSTNDRRKLQARVNDDMKQSWMAGEIGEDEYRALRKQSTKDMDERVARAMKAFFGAFGVVDPNSLGEDGMPTAEQARNLTEGMRAYLPTTPEQSEGANGSISGTELYDLAVTLRNELEAHPDLYVRDAEIYETINFLRTGYFKGKHLNTISAQARASTTDLIKMMRSGVISDGAELFLPAAQKANAEIREKTKGQGQGQGQGGGQGQGQGGGQGQGQDGGQGQGQGQGQGGGQVAAPTAEEPSAPPPTPEERATNELNTEIAAAAAQEQGDTTAAEESVPTAEEPAPAPTAEESAPTAEKPAPTAEKPAPKEEQVKTKEYVVRENDDLIAVAIEFGVEPKKIRKINGLSQNDEIKAGQVLKIPEE